MRLKADIRARQNQSDKNDKKYHTIAVAMSSKK